MGTSNKTKNKSMGSEVVYLFYLGSAALVAPKKLIHKNAQDLRSCLLEFVGSNPISCIIYKINNSITNFIFYK